MTSRWFSGGGSDRDRIKRGADQGLFDLNQKVTEQEIRMDVLSETFATKDLVWRAMGTGAITIIVLLASIATLVTSSLRLAESPKVEIIAMPDGDDPSNSTE